eukprot:scaffold27929_cov107-Isochrysis_galbana.AAC.2
MGLLRFFDSLSPSSLSTKFSCAHGWRSTVAWPAGRACPCGRLRPNRAPNSSPSGPALRALRTLRSATRSNERETAV